MVGGTKSYYITPLKLHQMKLEYEKRHSRRNAVFWLVKIRNYSRALRSNKFLGPINGSVFLINSYSESVSIIRIISHHCTSMTIRIHPSVYSGFRGSISLCNIFAIGTTAVHTARIAIGSLVCKGFRDFFCAKLSIFHCIGIHIKRLQTSIFSFLIGQADEFLSEFVNINLTGIGRTRRTTGTGRRLILAAIQAAVDVEVLYKPGPSAHPVQHKRGRSHG